MMLTIITKQDGIEVKDVYNVMTDYPEEWAKSVIKTQSKFKNVEYIGVEVC